MHADHKANAKLVLEQLDKELGLNWPEPQKMGFVKTIAKTLELETDLHVVRGFYRLLLQKNNKQPPRYSIAKLIFAIYRLYRNSIVFDTVADILSNPKNDPFARLAELYLTQKHEQSKREQHAAVLSSYLPSLNAFGFFLKSRLKMRSVPPIKATTSSDKPNHFGHLSAYTDGESIFLSNVRHTYLKDAKVPGMLNGYFMYYLMAHEQAHIGLGSYDLNLKSVRGKRLIKRFSEEAIQKAKERIEQEEQRILQHLRKQDAQMTLKRLRKRTDLADFFYYFSNPNLAKTLFNILEDGRLEWSFIKPQLPGLFLIQEAFSAHYHANYGMTAELSSEGDNFLTGLLAICTNQEIDYQISSRLQTAWEAVQARVAALLSIPKASVYDSSSALIDIYELLEEHDVLDSLGNSKSVLATDMAQSWDISIRRKEQLQKDKKKDLEEQGETIDPLDLPTGHRYPEYDGNRLIENAVAVRETHLKFKTPSEMPTTLTMDFAPWLAKTTRVPSSIKRYHYDGEEIDMDLVPDFLSAMQAGISIPITYGYHQVSRPAETWILIDASISMETPRKSLSGREAMTRAKEIAQHLSVMASRYNSRTRIFVGLDAGRRNVMLMELSEGLQQLTSIRAVSVGGFRAGAMLRHLNRLHMGKNSRRRLFIITDGAPSYLNTSTRTESALRELREHMCVHCGIRSACVNESDKMRIEPRLAGIWRSLDYQYRDLRHAIDHSTPNGDSIFLLLLNDFLDRPLLDHYVEDYWCDATNDSSLLDGLRRISERQESRSYVRTSFEQQHPELALMLN